jgi:3-oxoacyl-[acyl-carrier protein] reductase
MSNVTVITGGTSGIGKAIVLKVLQHAGDNDKIIVNYGSNVENANALIQGLSPNQQAKVHLIQANLSEYDEMSRLVKEVKSMTDHIDWLVLNTGIGTYVPFEEYDTELWEKVMRTNVNVPAFIVKELKDLMAREGNIVFMGSHAGQVTYSSSIVYGVSKAAVHFLAQSLVKVFDEKRVSVNAIAPGFIETRWQDGRSSESTDRINNKIGAHRFGTPEEVASLCYEILSNDYLNGSVYDVHGGYGFF